LVADDLKQSFGLRVHEFTDYGLVDLCGSNLHLKVRTGLRMINVLIDFTTELVLLGRLFL
jgi:hypothetical protein